MYIICLHVGVRLCVHLRQPQHLSLSAISTRYLEPSPPPEGLRFPRALAGHFWVIGLETHGRGAALRRSSPVWKHITQVGIVKQNVGSGVETMFSLSSNTLFSGCTNLIEMSHTGTYGSHRI